MKEIKNYQELDKLKGGRTPEEIEMIDNFFMELNERINLSIKDREELLSHYFNAFDYYLDHDKTIKDIIDILNHNNIKNFYKERERKIFRLDNAANIYPLSMRYGQMFMFRLSVSLKENVEPSILQMALDFSLKRFPTFSAVLRNGVFWHYLESTNIPVKVEEENDIPCKPIALVLRGSKSFRVLYYKNRISVELFHAITDGTGGMVFLKTLLREYFILLGREVPIENGILDINDNVKDEETVDEFVKSGQGKNPGKLISSKSLQLDGKFTSTNPYQILHFVLETDKVKEIAKKHNVTVTSYILGLLFLACKKSISKDKGTLAIQVPINGRRFFNLKTLRNFTLIVNVNKKIDDINDKESLMIEIQKQIKEQANKEEITKMANESNVIVKRINYLPLLLKALIIKYAYPNLVANNMALCLSNLGIIKVPKEIEDDIDHFDFIYTPSKPNRITTSLITFKNQIRFTIIKACKEETFENEMLRLLKEEGLNVLVEGSIKYGN